jgi:hypothetical protein
MELRSSEHQEPSHIHVPRPSRVAVRPIEPDLMDLCEMFVDRRGASECQETD